MYAIAINWQSWLDPTCVLAWVKILIFKNNMCILCMVLLLKKKNKFTLSDYFEPLFPTNLKAKTPAVPIRSKIPSFEVGKDKIHTDSTAIRML